jgi:uncharacterized phage-associated protein
MSSDPDPQEGLSAAPRTSAAAVANFLLGLAEREGRALTQLKLQKLVYFCYAWYAGNTGKELFGDDIEAWNYGPVVRTLYQNLSRWGREPIEERIFEFDWDSGDLIAPMIEDRKQQEIVEAVWDAYKAKPASWLVSATHAPSEPWGLVSKNIRLRENRNQRIPFHLVERVYKEKVRRSAKTAETA